MELYSGAKMVNEKYLKTKYVISKNREFTVFLRKWQLCYAEIEYPYSDNIYEMLCFHRSKDLDCDRME
jgi:hypothetical protein